MSLLVLCLVLAQAIAIPDTQTAWPAEFSASGSVQRLNQSSYGGTDARGSAGARWFVGRPLLDDENPLAVQAYLQRLNHLSLSFGGSGLWAGDSASSYRHSNREVAGSLGAHSYRGAWVLGGGLNYERVADHQSGGALVADHDLTTQYWSASVSSGVRSGTLEVQGTYRWRSYYNDGHALPATWGQAVVDLQSVLDNQIYLHLDGYTLTDGGGTSGDVEFFSTPEVGAWITGFLEEGQVYVNSTTDYDRHGLSLGFGWWASRRCELQLAAGFTTAQRSKGDSVALTEGFASFAIVVRAPKRYRPAEPAFGSR